MNVRETVIDWVILGLVLLPHRHMFLTRKTAGHGMRIGKVHRHALTFAFLLGLALLGVLSDQIGRLDHVGLHVGVTETPGGSAFLRGL